MEKGEPTSKYYEKFFSSGKYIISHWSDALFCLYYQEKKRLKKCKREKREKSMKWRKMGEMDGYIYCISENMYTTLINEITIIIIRVIWRVNIAYFIYDILT